MSDSSIDSPMFMSGFGLHTTRRISITHNAFQGKARMRKSNPLFLVGVARATDATRWRNTNYIACIRRQAYHIAQLHSHRMQVTYALRT